MRGSFHKANSTGFWLSDGFPGPTVPPAPAGPARPWSPVTVDVLVRGKNEPDPAGEGTQPHCRAEESRPWVQPGPPATHQARLPTPRDADSTRPGCLGAHWLRHTELLPSPLASGLGVKAEGRTGGCKGLSCDSQVSGFLKSEDSERSRGDPGDFVPDASVAHCLRVWFLTHTRVGAVPRWLRAGVSHQTRGSPVFTWATLPGPGRM